MADLESVELNCGYTFKDKELLKRALTLASFDNACNNESLECLGDALLTFIVAEKYYLGGATEGGITEQKQLLISDRALKPVSERLGLDKALLKGKGDDNNQKAVPSAYEALTAAIYLDGGLEEAKKFALSTLTPVQDCNFIGLLQELLQGEGEQPPEYEQSSVGTPQKPMQMVKVTVEGVSFSATEKNGAQAKKQAARKAYEYLTAKRNKE